MRVVEPGNGMRADVTAATIHKGVHDARPDATCVFHLHPPYATAMGQWLGSQSADLPFSSIKPPALYMHPF